MPPIYIKTPAQIAVMRQSANLLSRTHGHIAAHVQAGMRTRQLDELAETYIKAHGGIPSFKGYQGFPATLCISVNDQVVHGIPDGYILQEGDILSIDCGVCYENYHSDAAFTYPVGKIDRNLLDLLQITKEALYKGIEKATTDNNIGDISYAIQQHIEMNNNYQVVREYTGHGIGHFLHEAPDIPNFGSPQEGQKVQEGMTLAIEPIAVMGSPEIQHKGKWGVYTKDQGAVAHFEHTIAVVNGKPEILTTYQYINQALKQYG